MGSPQDASNVDYSEELEPVATEEDVNTYESHVQEEIEEEQMLERRFSEQIPIDQ
ncbi:hypothetical protein QZH41_014812 [Actinostola sp. cb2023]|nr:hypothetical protein QZH41_014812 [Actinostola sp. cb2023]